MRGQVQFDVSLTARADVRLSVYYDALGRLVARPQDGPLGPGVHSVSIDAAGWPTAVYVVVAEQTGAGGAVRSVQRFTVVR